MIKFTKRITSKDDPFSLPGHFSLRFLKDTPKTIALMRIFFKNVLIFESKILFKKWWNLRNALTQNMVRFCGPDIYFATFFKRDPKNYSINADFLQKCAHFWNPKFCSKNDQIYEIHWLKTWSVFAVRTFFVTFFKRDPKKYSINADFLQKCAHFLNPKYCSKNDQIYEVH